MPRRACLIAVLLFPTLTSAQPGKGNRLAYLDEVDPYYPSHKFPKLTTPMWVGEPGVEAVVILGIDDMKEPKRYETFLRPILRRLQEIDGRAPVSIMTCAVDPKDPQLQTWLKEGVSLECHTFDHPCPFFKGGFDKAKGTYDKCVDLLHEVPNSKPVAFRVPCCDSMNTPSPRFYAEIFNKVTAKGNFLQIDTSVFNVFTPADPELPKKLVLDDQGNERFTPYLPKDRSFVNWIENYPYPYVIGRLCWQFPCMTPSDWQAQHRHKPNNPKTVEDWKAALDCTVIKQGVFCMVFHPHGWIRNDQVVDFIDYAVQKHGKKVKFLTFKEALERLNRVLLNRDYSLRDQKTGTPNRNLIMFAKSTDCHVRLLTGGEIWTWVPAAGGGSWKREPDPFKPNPKPPTYKPAPPPGKLRWFIPIQPEGPDFDIYGSYPAYELHSWEEKTNTSTRLPFSLPPGARIQEGRIEDTGFRLLDINGDGKYDVIFSNEKEYGIYLFENMEKGWSRKVMAGKAGDKNALPPIAKNGSNNGFWVHSGHLWWANEDTVLLKDHVDRRSIKELLKGAR